MGINSNPEFLQVVTDSNKELYWIYDHSYQIKESSFCQKLHYASFANRLKEGESVVQYLSRLCCNTAQSRSICSMVRVWPQCWQVVGGPQDKIWDFVAFVWPIRNQVIATSWALVRCLNFLVCPCVGFKRHKSLPCMDTSHLIFMFSIY